MPYRWRYEDAAGNERTGPQETFDDQQEAELWLTDSWEELLDDGVEQVTLLDEDDAPVYGPMGLRAAD